MSGRSGDSFSAVFFIQGQQVTRQLQMNEFDALLDGMSVLNEYKDTEAHAVYLEIDERGAIEALVFFKLYVDEAGEIDPTWQLPLDKLARSAAKGPDLGAGPVRLACRSQCTINWHQKDLWDPDMSPGSSHFNLLRKAVDENRLDLPLKQVEQDIPVLSSVHDGDEDISVEKRNRLARVIKSQRLRIRTLESDVRAMEEQGERESKIQQYAARNQLQASKQALSQLQVSYDRLLASAQEKDRLIERLEKDLYTLQHAPQSHPEPDTRHEIALACANEKIDVLKAELNELKQEQESGEPGLMEQLRELDIVYVAYHAGVGHVSMAYGDLIDYTEDPVGFVAAKCHLSREHYSSWLSHYEHAVCQSVVGDELCLNPVVKVQDPSDFQPGVSDLCADCIALNRDH